MCVEVRLGTVGHAVNADSWEFKIATFSLDMGNVASGTTRFNFQNGTGFGTNGATYAVGRSDGVGFGIFTGNPGDMFASSQGVTLLPEATGLGVMGAASIGLLTRVRK